jgi:hypothetical protein
MKLTLHHINLCSTNVPAMDEFYREGARPRAGAEP